MRRSAFARFLLFSPLCWLGGLLFASDANDPSAADAQAVANRVQEHITQEHTARLTARIKRLESILAGVKQRIGKKRDELTVMAEAFGTDDHQKLDLRQQATIEVHKQLRSELSRVRDERLDAESRLKALNSDVLKSDENSNAEDARDTPPEPAKTPPGDASDLPERQPNKIDRDQDAKKGPVVNDSERPGKLNSKTRTKTFLTRKLELFSKHESLLVEEMNGLKEDVKEFGRASIELQMKIKEIENLEPIYRNLVEEIERTKVELKIDQQK